MDVYMDNECMYLEIEDATSCHVDVFDHPRYKYHCAEKNKDLPFGIFQLCGTSEGRFDNDSK